MSRGGDIDFGAFTADVARALWGGENKALSSGAQLRFGARGGRSVDLAKGVWADHSQEHASINAGGCLDLIRRETGLSGADAVDWMRQKGFDVGEKPNGRANGMAPSNRDFSPRSTAGEEEPPPFEPDDPGPGEPARPKPRLGPIVATYDYLDEAGDLLFLVTRHEPGLIEPDGTVLEAKTFRQRRPARDDDDPGKVRDGWVMSVKGVRQVPYRLAEVQEAIAAGAPVFVVEGEKDVENLDRLGIPATTNAQGAGKWLPEMTAYFAGADVVILPDNDSSGAKHRDAVGAALRDAAKRVRVLDLPGLPPKGDVSDWIEAGGTPEKLYDLVAKEARTWRASPPISNFGARTWQELDRPGPEHDWLIEDLLSIGDRSIIAGPSRSGKSFLAIDAAMSVVRGERFFGYDVKPGLVVYQAGEGARGILKRLRAYRSHHGIPADADLPFVLLSSAVDLYHEGGSTRPLIEEIKAWAAFRDEPLRLVVIDTLSTATAGADENSGKDMSTVLANIAKLSAECGCHVMLVHHMNAGGTKLRGHTSILANVDQVIEVANAEGTRTATLSKQKDGEDGIAFRFELKSVRVATVWRRDGSEKPVTSCIVSPLGDAQAVAAARERQGFGPTPTERRVLTVLFEALKRHGRVLSTEQEREHRIPEARDVIEWADYRSVAQELSPGEERSTDAIRKEFERVRDKLLGANVLRVSKPYMWWAGRPVRGFPQTFPKADTTGTSGGPGADESRTEGGHGAGQDAGQMADTLSLDDGLPWG